MTTVQRNLEAAAGGTKVLIHDPGFFYCCILTWFLLACTESQLTGINLNTDWTGYDGCSIKYVEDLNSNIKSLFKITSRV